ncbi:hypothetical protein GLOTRDRAFT_137252 [Gloeophyllum trabeum ATCC 11539]|uniref:RING-type domain-containing protein n=1 Tax=Gloeophyllum trabeum (strain ATCC 11539 / FP-39264 / Madison 617) TaxID=670483 RepID=S7RUZ5_GLOTA|nr:uncharacterized protein GLOTRDRAFT_137252 [Gloeophyllum trabeum ATCC 11539]EPQ58575.1 hypothetical protein GLOTRDRAFT_137252 [Gloeophyllum trabeum ATCC 11539]
MAASRNHSFPSSHSSASAQSKSHVLAGVQDAYWSDDEAEDAECPLCLEEMDISDLNFKPCVCGYQICRFCWHHIKENLNGRCPACRREYSDENVQFKPINKEDHKRLMQQKKQRERERKELDALGRRHLANVRVVQRSVVYVVGIGPRFAKEELIPTLRSNEYFGQYGKITKIVLVKRSPPGGRSPVVGLYITYHRREDAARAIAGVDGAPSPGGGNDVMRASYGTAKYCMAFLRGQTCNDHSCMNLHEWGDEKDCFTKEDLTTLKHTLKDMENRPRSTFTIKKADEAEPGLPRGASWAQKGSGNSALHNNSAAANQASTARSSRRGGTRQPRIGASSSTAPSTAESKASAPRHPRTTAAAASAKATSQPSSSRPPTPASTAPRPSTPADAKIARVKEQDKTPPRSPTSSVAVESDVGSRDVASPSPAPRPQSVDSVQSSVPSAPPGLSGPPPGLTAPPGLPPPKRLQTESPQIGMVPSQSSYQMSAQMQALLDDVKARREAPTTTSGTNPFPDLDRMLQHLQGGDEGGFSFNLDPKLASDTNEEVELVPPFEAEANIPFQGNYLDTFPGLRSPHLANPYGTPPGLAIPHNPSRPLYESMAKGSPLSQNYSGSFNPFAEAGEDTSAPTGRSSLSGLDEERQVSRFGFARGRQGSTATSSPLHGSPITANDSFSHGQFYSSPRLTSPTANPQPQQWHFPTRQPEYTQPGSNIASPLVQNAQAAYPQHQPSRFQPFDDVVSEAQLRDFIRSSRERDASMRNVAQYDQQPRHANSFHYSPAQPFSDPAIMSSARFSSPVMTTAAATVAAGFATQHSSDSISAVPPGLHFAESAMSSPVPSSILAHGTGSGPSTNMEMSQGGSSVQASRPVSPTQPLPALSPTEFPALGADNQASREGQQASEGKASPAETSAQAKADKKAAKRAAAAERAAERRRIAEEKAAARAAEKAKVAAEKAAEKEKAAALKAEKDRVDKDKLEKEQAEKEKLEKEKAERERQEKERAEAAAKEKAARTSSTPDSGSGKKQTAATKAKAVDSREASPAPSKSGGKSRTRQSSREPSPPPSRLDLTVQVPILSKMPKKNKPATKPIKIPKEEELASEAASALPATQSDGPQGLLVRATHGSAVSSNNSRAQSIDRMPLYEPTSLAQLFADIDQQCPWMRIADHPVFDLSKINPAAKMPLEYGPLVHALSALSVGGGSFANNMPSGSIDNAVSSFQQLLETLTQTISDLLRLLPRTTWDDSSSFDGVLRDMLKGDDFLDEGTEEGSGRDDEVAALTLALERRARWMEVQLSKLEELHRDINTAAVRAVLAFNDNGWDRQGWLPRVGNTLARFDKLGLVEENGALRPMTADELEKKLTVAKEAAVFAETEMRESVERLQVYRPYEEDEY